MKFTSKKSDSPSSLTVTEHYNESNGVKVTASSIHFIHSSSHPLHFNILQQRLIHIPFREEANILKRLLFRVHRNFHQRQIRENNHACFLEAAFFNGERFELGQIYDQAQNPTQRFILNWHHSSSLPISAFSPRRIVSSEGRSREIEKRKRSAHFQTRC